MAKRLAVESIEDRGGAGFGRITFNDGTELGWTKDTGVFHIRNGGMTNTKHEFLALLELERRGVKVPA